MNQIKKLAGQTVIYGFGTIAPRLLNFLLLTPFYTRQFEQGEYGVFTELYAYIVFLLVILTYGMETGFFRFSKSEKDFSKVYSTSLITLFISSAFFVVLSNIYSQNIATIIGYANKVEYIRWFCIIVSIDAFTAIPFAKLRYLGKAKKFGILKIINVLVNIGLNVFFLVWLPKIISTNPESFLKIIYNPELRVGYVFIANLVASLVTLILLIPEMFDYKVNFDFQLLKRILKYSFPLLIVGIAGTVNEVLDKILMKHLVTDNGTAIEQVGLYGANYKMAVLMTIFIQMFRYAAEPYFFSRMDDKDAKIQYATIMKLFIIFGLLIFLGVVLYIDIVKYFIGSEFREGLKIVPIILLANLFLGVIFNLSIWYKLTNLTKYGAYISLIGATITIILNIILVPKIGYLGAAWATFICYFIMVIISYYMGQKYYKIKYDLKSIGIYFSFALIIYFVNKLIRLETFYIQMIVSTLFMVLFISFVYKKENLRSFLKKD